ncbi:MAG: AMP-binding protein, partial [Xanthomonadales bacterium]|nr:AMP-binding protein [Xanthomonadales bacterium]
MSNKPWQQHYAEGVPAEIDLSQYSSVVDILEQSCQQFRDRPAFENFDTVISFGELDRLSQSFAAALQARGLQKGDRVALMLPNTLQYPIALFGVLRAGMVVVNTNPMYTARELKHQLNDSGAKAIVVVDNFAHVLEKVMDEVAVEHVFTTAVGDMLGFPKGALLNFVLKRVRKAVPAYSLPKAERFKNVLKQHDGQTPKTEEIGFTDIAFLQYTGGTTGVAKGAVLTHRNMVANMLQAKSWLGDLDVGSEVIVTALPLYHIFALTANCLVFMSLGARNLLITNPRDMDGFVKALGTSGFTAITGVNTLFNSMLNTPGFEQLDFSKLKLVLGGGMAVQRAVAERWKEVTGVTLVEAYGLTETSPAACINPMTLSEYNGCIGLPISSTECAILGEDGQWQPVGEVGELCIRGPQVMAGYWQRPEETAKVLSEDGWLRTGDMACMDEHGFFKIVDRKKDMILVSGFNVYPNEIEDVIAAHEKVLEVAAIGVPHEHSGEIVKVCI